MYKNDISTRPPVIKEESFDDDHKFSQVRSTTNKGSPKANDFNRKNELNRKFAEKQAEIDELLLKSHVHTTMLKEDTLEL